jgi:hypothetical protein
MVPAPPLTAAGRFARIIEGLCRTVAVRGAGRVTTGPLVILIWTRLRRMGARFAALAARVYAGALPSPARPRCLALFTSVIPAKPVPASEPGAKHQRTSPSLRLPTSFAWLVRFAPEVTGYRSQLYHLLSDPEFATLLSAAPQMGRVLRPLCRMLGIRVPKDLLPPSPTGTAPRAPGQTHPGATPIAAQAPPPQPVPGPDRTADVPAFIPPALA